MTKKPLLVFLSLMLSTSVAHASSSARGTFTSASAGCYALATHDEPGLLGVDFPLGVAPPLVAPLFNQHESSIHGPKCPARSNLGREVATSNATATPADGRWSVDLSATTTSGAAYADAVVSLAATIDAKLAGDLFVRFDEVAQYFDQACNGCDAPPQAGYLLTITVHSAGGDASVTCGTSAANEQRMFTLPDERCGLGEDGGAARLPVSAGPVSIDVEIFAFTFVSGANSRAVDGHAFAQTSARIVSFHVTAP